MKALFVSGEAIPFAKTGGLADVVGTLPGELKKQGVETAVIMPKYQNIPAAYQEKIKHLTSWTVYLGGRSLYCGVEVLKLKGVTYYFIDNREMYYRPGLYGYWDDGERFAFFCRAVLDALPRVGFQPDIIHVHDWHAAMVNLLLNAQYRHEDFYRNIKTVLTIHNLKFQGIFPKSVMDLLYLDQKHFNMDELEYYGMVNYLKGGLANSDAITTVSETYAREIMSPFFGEGLDGFLWERREQISGIINGIDYKQYAPKTDGMIVENYGIKTMDHKIMNKTYLQEQMGLPVDPAVPMVTMVTRLTEQKGLDLVARVFHEMMARDIQMVVLGCGEKHYEKMFEEGVKRYPDKLAVFLGFDDELAHRIYAGGDIFLMPSLFEPCGIGQLIALHYGNVPLVRETGGLIDTITSYREDSGEGNGFSFANFNAHDMLYTLDRAVGMYHRKEIWKEIMRRGMAADFSWKKSAQSYTELYQKLLTGKNL